MFENLSNREKKLLLAIGALVPIMIVFFGFITMRNKLKANNDRLNVVKDQIAEQKELEFEGALADRRQAFYANASLPPSENNAGNKYQRWLKPAITESGLTRGPVIPKGGLKLRSGSEIIGQSFMFSVNATGRLPAFNDFLSKFYQMDMLHRITKIEVTPGTEGLTTTRDGLLELKMDFEILSLKNGKNRSDFDEFPQHPANSEKDYAEILRRNIFGPANSPPIVTASNKTTTTGKSYGFSITATDANKPDLLTFELVEGDVPDAFLKELTRKTSRSARFEMPDMPPGKYNFTVKVSDNGFPAKSTTKDFTVTVKPKSKPQKSNVAEAPKKPKEVDYIRLVRVTGILQEPDRKWKVWLSIGPTGERPLLAVGETFEVGKKKYEVMSIERNEATFSGDNKTFTGRPDSTLRELIETEL